MFHIGVRAGVALLLLETITLTFPETSMRSQPAGRAAYVSKDTQTMREKIFFHLPNLCW